jgi:hypothetical protein
MDEQIDLSFLREPIPKKEFHRYRTIELPKTGKVKVRPFTYDEVKQLNEFNTDNIDVVYDNVILASTDLTEASLLNMDSIEREYLLLHMRSISYIDPRFEFDLPCDNCNKHQPMTKSIEEFPFLPPIGVFDEFKVSDGFGEYLVKLKLTTYSNEKQIASAYENNDLRKELYPIAFMIESIKGDFEYNVEDGLDACLDFLSASGVFTNILFEKIDSFSFGLQSVVEKWTCRYCDHHNETEVDPTDFLYSLS